MEATYLNSWIVIRAPWRALIILGCAFGAVLSQAKTLTGVVYSNELGNGIHRAGRFELAVGKRIHTVEYGEPLERHFQGPACNDIGAEWSVVVARVDNSVYADSVTCTGRTEHDIHKPWLLVRSYLEGLSSSGTHTSGLSHRYQSSREFRRFAQQLSSRDLKFHFGLGRTDLCLKIVKVGPAARVRLATHCAITLQGQNVVLLFDVERSNDNGKWEIDGITVE
jgi:hypothetical protein